MQFIIEIRFEDKDLTAIVHLVTLINIKSEEAMAAFCVELEAAIKRNGAIVLLSTFLRIDNNPELKERQIEYYRYYLSRATATVKIDEYTIDDPDQSKNVYDNLIEKMYAGKNAIATEGAKHNIPVRVIDKNSRNPITGEFFYSSIEHIHSA